MFNSLKYVHNYVLDYSDISIETLMVPRGQTGMTLIY